MTRKYIYIGNSVHSTNNNRQKKSEAEQHEYKAKGTNE